MLSLQSRCCSAHVGVSMEGSRYFSGPTNAMYRSSHKLRSCSAQRTLLKRAEEDTDLDILQHPLGREAVQVRLCSPTRLAMQTLPLTQLSHPIMLEFAIAQNP